MGKYTEVAELERKLDFQKHNLELLEDSIKRKRMLGLMKVDIELVFRGPWGGKQSIDLTTVSYNVIVDAMKGSLRELQEKYDKEVLKTKHEG